jgi:glutamyl/glutaminyl-tRNA synthetase
MAVTWEEHQRIKVEHRKKCRGKALLIAQEGFEKYILSGTDLVEKLLLELCVVPDWNEHEIETCVKKFLEGNGMSLKEFAPFLRAALTGSTESLPIFIVMQVLGLAETADRLRDPWQTAKWQLRTSGN